jgi:DNA modification methylase
VSVEIIHGDARSLPLADDSVDLIVTSPPYFGLRSYTDGGEQYDGQIGAEATPATYVDALIECTREWMRVLKPGGNLWVNLGDKYGPDKSLMGLPWEYARACRAQLGLILRAELIWAKPNGLPESVTDRVRRSHEQWFHLVQQPRYYSGIDEIREVHTAPERTAGANAMNARNANLPRTAVGPYAGPNPLGKLPGSVWEVATQPLKVPASLGVDHFAAFPLEWPLRIIRGWSPSGICTECGEGRRPVSFSARTRDRGGRRKNVLNDYVGEERTSGLGFEQVTQITGYACACPEPTAPTRPSTVLDPFGGTGTTALAADVLGRNGISVDASSDYCRIAHWRTSDPGERARAMGVPKPDPEMEGQLSLLDQLEAAS